MDKIYSRPRIRIIRFKNMNKKNKFKFMIYMFLVMIFFLIVMFIKAAYPIYMSTCENAATSTAINILNKEVNEVMLVYNYNDLVNIGKDEKRKNCIYRSEDYAN